MSISIAVVAPSSPRPSSRPAVHEVAGGLAQGAVVTAGGPDVGA